MSWTNVSLNGVSGIHAFVAARIARFVASLSDIIVCIKLARMQFVTGDDHSTLPSPVHAHIAALVYDAGKKSPPCHRDTLRGGFSMFPFLYHWQQACCSIHKKCF